MLSFESESECLYVLWYHDQETAQTATELDSIAFAKKLHQRLFSMMNRQERFRLGFVFSLFLTRFFRTSLGLVLFPNKSADKIANEVIVIQDVNKCCLSVSHHLTKLNDFLVTQESTGIP